MYSSNIFRTKATCSIFLSWFLMLKTYFFPKYVFQMLRFASAAFIIYLVTIHKGQPKGIPNASAPTPSSTQTITASSITFPLCPHNGEELNPGDIRPTDDQWCSGVTCTIDGLQAWRYYNCTGDASSETTTQTPHEQTDSNNQHKRRKNKRI